MKLVFLGTSSAIVYYMRFHRIIKLTYDKEQDTFKYLLLIAPSAVLALLTTHVYTVLEVLWTFSIYLEAVAIMPQLVLLQRTQNIDNLTGNYVFLLGCAAWINTPARQQSEQRNSSVAQQQRLHLSTSQLQPQKLAQDSCEMISAPPHCFASA
eukprot:GHRQ01037527.1.p1 GENE.GHRQ01037527.1~~GHRQ01037527.1.p1  ORF type:complete len:153 (+),score=35.41 GHRQ01037527.1:638-1096(+)